MKNIIDALKEEATRMERQLATIGKAIERVLNPYSDLGNLDTVPIRQGQVAGKVGADP